jgi:hypothetical protein
MSRHPWIWGLLCLGACRPELKSGEIRCGFYNECPPDMKCYEVDNYCYRDADWPSSSSPPKADGGGDATIPVDGADLGDDAGLTGIDDCHELPLVGSARLCVLPNGSQGYQKCSAGAPVGACTGFSLGDSGLSGFGDAGGFSSYDAGTTDAESPLLDGGFTLGDGGFQMLDAGKLECPSGLVCNRSLAQNFGLPIAYCEPAPGGALAPPGCSTVSASCMVGSATGTCTDLSGLTTSCIVPCSL